MPVVEKSGNLFTSTAPVYAHGVNARGLMGAGIAAQFRDRFPAMNDRYEFLCKSFPSERLVGQCTMWRNSAWPFDDPLYVANIFSQDDPGPHARMDWLMRGLNQTVISCYQLGLGSIALPQIGSGIGGLEWTEVRQNIYQSFDHLDITIELWTYQQV